jgi:uncharacterized protein
MAEIFSLAGTEIKPGEQKIISLEVGKLYDTTEVTIPVKVIHGKKTGPTLFISAAIHGDEINGTEIIKRLLRHKALKTISGTLIAVPIVNVFGFNNRSRYLPDGRDLNRSFPGSKKGSLAARIAHLFITEIVDKSTHGIDLHTGAVHRNNLPQIRAWLENEETKRLARAFGVPVILNSNLRDGSLREAAVDRKIPMLLFEAGEALRHDEQSIRIGLHGILSVMVSIGMLDVERVKTRLKGKTFIALSSQWVRAPQSGTLRIIKHIGSHVSEGDLLGVVSDPFGIHRFNVRAKETGIIVGQTEIPLVNRGDALFHIATFKNPSNVEETMERFEDYISDGETEE